tara:strand:+ start:2675 stop:3076 length:402 start_codon:yes stop_codon:yes gene_type:complete
MLTPRALFTGGLSLRVSSAADLLDEKGNERSSKSISPVQTEADEPSFGSREAKLEGCVLQRKAWDVNVEILTPVFTSLRGPLPLEDLKRGAHGLSFAERLESARLKNAFDSNPAEEMAKAAMIRAASCRVGEL